MSVTQTASTIESASQVAGPAHATTPPTIRDDMLYEVVDGQVVEKIVGAREIEIAAILGGYLFHFARVNRVGRSLVEFLFRINVKKDLQRRPDVAFVSHSRWPFHRRVPDVPVWEMVPDLAVEVISPSNTAFEVQKKIHDYFEAGVAQVWVVYPDQAEVYVYASPTQIHVFQARQELDGGDLLPGFRLPLALLFDDEAE
jgi:Uma2 family endonuclease